MKHKKKRMDSVERTTTCMGENTYIALCYVAIVNELVFSTSTLTTSEKFIKLEVMIMNHAR